MNTVKHAVFGLIAYVASLIPQLTATHVTVDRSLLLSLIPGAVVALASALHENVTLGQAQTGLTVVEKYLGPLIARVEALEGKKPAAKS
jgi:hypothetical protein